MNFTLGQSSDDLLSLDRIRSTLIRLEDTIIFSLIERAQFAWNKKIYKKGEFPELKEVGFEGSWVEWFLLEIETFHAKARRYTSPDEHPFTSRHLLPPPILAEQSYPSLLHPASVKHESTNANPRILEFYVDRVVPGITRKVAAIAAIKGGEKDQDDKGDKTDARDDGNYGSSATLDVTTLQSLSRRIHFGMFVSESKFRSSPSSFIPHILSTPPNKQELEGLITKPEVEKALLIRLGNKAMIYGSELDAQGRLKMEEGKKGDEKIDWEEIVRLYRDHVIPLTKDIEVDYLVHRLDGVPQSQIDEWMAAGK